MGIAFTWAVGGGGGGYTRFLFFERKGHCLGPPIASWKSWKQAKRLELIKEQLDVGKLIEFGAFEAKS